MTKIQIRRDTSTNWQQYNPTPSSGEPCYETDTGKFKIGNGEQPYNSLPYQGSGVEDYNELENLPQINGIELTGNKTGTDLGLASSNEVNQLTSTVTGLQSSKQDTLTAGEGISIEKSILGQMVMDWYTPSGKLEPIPDTINMPAIGVTDTYYPFNQQVLVDGDTLLIKWDM